MNCNREAIALMHSYLDGELYKEDERRLRDHLQSCPSCQEHFQELKRTTTLVKNATPVSAPPRFTANVMANLPKEKKRKNYLRKLQRHPFLTAAAVFFILMFSGIFTAWNQDQQVTVSKQENLEIRDHTVIVPDGVTVEGDLVVRNGDLRIEGRVDGDITIINGDIVESDSNNESESDNRLDRNNLRAYSGELTEVNQVYEWVWYHAKKTFKEIFTFEQD
ncbi:Transmembrane transcriptional regulator (anti-sigma factor RsiW) [Halobacillus karajensis]|uniref:zf-HC2 domain-containing protein n=1 Tax=Halobacillus karajensis TaxID=195088 RepID=UPI0008A7B393|nr:zf-HC2 domain-containing protein [Halobacillus karajensis]SEI07249.1 Transmembrane transcriptional regulator (anti-sigma factor RsiW) [Halobacillus karajensis]